MKKFINPLFLGLFCLVIISACKKDEEKTNKTDLITAKPWKITKVEMTLLGQTVDVTEEFSEGECANDNTTVFSKDGKYEEKIGTTTCYSGEEDYVGTWEWKDSETKLVTTI